MVVPIRLVTVHDEHPDLSRRELHSVTRAAYAAMGIKWAADLLPEHFGAGAGQRFGYAKRTEKYLRRKDILRARGLAIGGRHDDLLLTGRLRESVLRSARNLIAAYPTRVTITMHGPPYFTLRPRAKHTKRIAEEVLAMNPRHERLIGDAGDRGFNARLRALRASRRMRKVTTTT
jgi:hypothetical protein